MKDKGFTLVELMAVIVILGFIALIAVPNVLKTINNSRGKLSSVQESTLERACKNYVTAKVGEIDDCKFVTLEMLHKGGYLEAENFTDPNGRNKYTSTSGFLVLWDDDTNQYIYEFKDSDPGTCPKA